LSNVPAPRKRRATPGAAFTVEHFAAWAHRLRTSAGERFVLEPYQARFVADLFAGKAECWLVVPEANGKTTLVALLALYHIEHRSEAWVTVAAASRDQAGLIFRQAAGFVDRNDVGMFKCLPGYRRIHCELMRSSIQVFAADASTGDGVIPTLALLDELHRHRNLELYRTWAGKLDKTQAQLVTISTAGEPGGEFEELREQFRQNADTIEREPCFVRAVGPSSVLHEYAIPEDGDPEDLELVKLANPFSEITVESLRAKRARPSWALSHWRRFTCNIPTRADTAAITEAEWAAAETPDEIPAGQPVWLGLDLGFKYDTTALVPLWVRDSEYRLFGPAVVLEPPRNGNQLDAHLIEAALLEIHERNPVETVVMDMTEGAQLSQWIEETLGAEVVDRTQSVPLQVLDYQRFMEALRYGWLRHCGDDGLTRHALNAGAQVLPGGDVRFTRIKQSRTVSSAEQRRRSIDALVAAAMVHTSATAEAAGLQPFAF
jgi:phage terminase large subunit-like protein